MRSMFSRSMSRSSLGVAPYQAASHLVPPGHVAEQEQFSSVTTLRYVNLNGLPQEIPLDT